MSSSAITTQVAQLKIGSVQNQADSSSVYSNGVWSFKNSTALTSVTITDAGNVGIGTASPSFAAGTGLAINGGANQARLALKNNATGDGASDGLQIAVDSSSISYIYNYENTAMVFGTNNAERMRIDASGNLLVGKNTVETSKVYISKTTSSGGWNNQAITLENIGLTAPGIGFHHPQYAQAAVFKFWGPSAQFECLNPVESAFINIKALTCIDASDYRLKEQIQPLASGLEKVLKLKPCYFTWKANKEKNLGFIAHELQEVIPEAVYGEKDAVREDGSADYQGMSSNAVIAVLTAAIQEQQAQIEALKAEVAALKAP